VSPHVLLRRLPAGHLESDCYPQLDAPDILLTVACEGLIGGCQTAGLQQACMWRRQKACRCRHTSLNELIQRQSEDLMRVELVTTADAHPT